MNTMEMIILACGIIGAYLLGSISSAILVCHLLRLPDPRQEGSKNPGTTNVLRIGGRFAAALTLLGDAAKGAVPVLLVKLVTVNPWIISATLFAAIIGHMYPLFFQFKGGKGIATIIGGLLALSPILGGLFLLTWVGIFVITRYSSLSAIVAIATMPGWAWYLLDKRYMPGLTLLALIILWKHRENIKRLATGKETRSTFKKA